MTTSELQRLLKYPHAGVFDKTPDARVAIRVHHPNDARWEIADEHLTIWGGDDKFDFDLTQYSIGTLAAALEQAGFSILSLDSDVSMFGAIALAEGSSSELVSNGNGISIFTSPLWIMLSGYAVELREVSYQLGQALRQMVIWQSESEWVDLWGALYGVSRHPGESDASYQARIPREAFRIRCNAYGIEQAILDDTGFNVKINEPWKDIFTLDDSALSGPCKFYDGVSVGYHLIQPSSDETVDWDAVLKVIDRNRAAGVVVLQPQVHHWVVVDATGHSAFGMQETEHMSRSIMLDRTLLDYNLIEDVSLLNYPAIHTREIWHYGNGAIGPREWEPWGWLYGPSWASTDYLATSSQQRSFRVQYSDVEYISQYWDATSLSWQQSQPESWLGLNPFVQSVHTRS